METRNMKVKEKSKAVKVEVVREVGSIESLLQTTDRGFVHADKALNDIPTKDLVTYAVTKLEAGQSALRLAVLFTGAVYKTCTEEKAKLYADGLSIAWGGMSKDILSIGKALPQLESTGLSLSNVRDLYGLRDVRKILLGDDKKLASRAVGLLNEGKPPRKVREAVLGSTPKAKEEGAPAAPAAPIVPAETQEDKADVVRSCFIGYADKIQAAFDHDERVKIAQQAIAKLKLAGWALQKVK